jgi:hypothetical protein
MQGRQAAGFYSIKSRPVQNCPKNVQQTGGGIVRYNVPVSAGKKKPAFSATALPGGRNIASLPRYGWFV